MVSVYVSITKTKHRERRGRHDERIDVEKEV
jgi:hypothetical protein